MGAFKSRQSKWRAILVSTGYAYRQNIRWPYEIFMFLFLRISSFIREEIFIYFSSCASIVGPCSGPDASLGSFEVSTNWDMRSATIRWSQLPADCENGPETGYEITMLDSQRNLMYVFFFLIRETKRDLLVAVYLTFFPSWLLFQRSEKCQLCRCDSIRFQQSEQRQSLRIYFTIVQQCWLLAKFVAGFLTYVCQQ